MKRGLRLRLALTHALVALLAIAVVAAIVFVAGGRRFDSYLSEVQRSRNEAVVNILTQTYKAPDGWDAAAIYALSQIARLNNVDVAVYSPRGQLLFTVQGRHPGGGMMGGGNGMMGGGASGATPAPQATSLSRDQFEVQSYPVVVDGQKVGTAEVYAPRNARAAAESAYQTALTRNLVIAALVAAVLAFLISLFVSRRITGPLEELTDAAEDVAGGNLAVRVSPRADDEVGALASAFNAMADRLARDEQWRRDMTADLSHELRTPLATIQSRIEALEDGVLPATPENLRVIGAEVERLGRLLGALRSLNELESEDVSVEHERLDLADVGRDAIAHAETVYAAKGVTLDGDLAPATVKGDRERLLQVAANLLDNALKFTPEGGRVVLAVASGGPWATLTVADSGPGIDPIDLPFIFDRFYRSQAARGTQGVGLGLAIARGLVEAQGGVIEAADRPEGGAELTVRLPAAG
ncbi:MAG: HAMP domain-containing protein [Actinobacteria bacterium]|nr:HAMP domain-containing protein [Actinomycetota bacterium]